jgi:hypothetical protein
MKTVVFFSLHIVSTWVTNKSYLPGNTKTFGIACCPSETVNGFPFSLNFLI